MARSKNTIPDFEDYIINKWGVEFFKEGENWLGKYYIDEGDYLTQLFPVKEYNTYKKLDAIGPGDLPIFESGGRW